MHKSHISFGGTQNQKNNNSTIPASFISIIIIPKKFCKGKFDCVNMHIFTNPVTCVFISAKKLK